MEKETSSEASFDIAALPVETDKFNEYAQGLNDTELVSLESALVEHFDQLRADSQSGKSDPDRVKKAADFVSQIKSLRKTQTERSEQRAEQDAKLSALHDDVHSGDTANTDASPIEGTVVESTDPPKDTEAAAESGKELEAIAASFASSVATAFSRMVPVEDNLRDTRDLNRHIRLSAAATHAPDAQVPAGNRDAVIVASADIPGFTQGGRIQDVERLGFALHSRARNLPATHNGKGIRVPVASLQRDFRFKLDKNATPDDINDILKAATNVETLVAAGGWCAPSEINYDFYNIVCEDGMIDLPSVGVVTRGGIQFPTSPSFGDIIAADPDGLWTWTEADDIAAVTGAPTKDCVRVPCPDFTDVRLQCDGLCLTAGNLVDYAYPELVANYLRLLMAARAHQTNTQIINQLVAASTAVSNTGATFGSSAAALLNSVELQAVSYRAKFRMCEDAILEVILPTWAKGTIRADIANRNGLAEFAVTDAMIADWFNIRNVRVQFVSDWQLATIGAATPPTAYPTTVQYLLYAPGTFVRGQGLQLDLGVVRDSVLNATNDHTAAWMEDCYLVAQVGHESRLVTTNVCIDGKTGANTITC